MLEKFRRGTFIKTIFWVMVIAFVGWFLFDLGMDITGMQSPFLRKGVIGKVGKDEIEYTYYQRVIDNITQNQRTEKNAELTIKDYARIRNDAWNYIVNELIVNQMIKKYKIKFTDEELVEYAKNNPPPELINNPYFQTAPDSTGKTQFDFEKYISFLTNLDNPEFENFRLTVEYISKLNLPRQKLAKQITSSIKLSDKELEEVIKSGAQKVKADFIRVNYALIQIDTSLLNDEALMKFYEANQDSFIRKNLRKVKYISIDIAPDSKDTLRVKTLADSLVKVLKAEKNITPEKSFEQLAKLYSNDTVTAVNGGDLGYFGRNRMVPQFDSVAFSLKVGEISEPFFTYYGLHIVMVDDKKIENGKELVRARHILLRIEKDENVLDSIKSELDYFADKARQTSFEESCNEFNYKYYETPYFAEGEFNPQLGIPQEIVDFAFASYPGNVSGVIEAKQKLWVCTVSDKKDEILETFEKSKNKVEAKLKTKLQKEHSKKWVDSIEALIKSGVSFNEIPKKLNQNFITYHITEQPFTRQDYVRDVGRMNDFIALAFSSNINEIVGPVSTDLGIYFLRVIERVEPSDAEIAVQKNQFRLQLERDKKSRFYQMWLDHLRDKIGVIDKREELFSVT